MYKKEFLNLLNSKSFPNYFFIFGNDEYQIETSANEIIKKFNTSNVLSMYFGEYDFKIAKAHLQESSLFDDKNLLHIKTDKKIPSKELKALISLCKNNTSNIFIFELFENDMKIVYDNQKAFESNFVRLFAPNNPNEAILILSEHAKKLGLEITSSALYHLYSLENESLYLSAGELNKLSNLGKNFNQKDIEELVFGLNGISFDSFFDKLVNLKDFRQDFEDYTKEASFNEMLFVNSIYNAFYRLFKIQTYTKITSKFDLAKSLGYNPPIQIVNKLKSQALSFNTDDFLNIFMSLNDTEFQLKTKNNLDKTTFLLSSLLSIQNIIAKSRKY